ncbi:molecular chaperone TorD family protein [Gammaproteobacteria bacterium]|nr:molecular chaperone TorD family protein [Gammaproteobacteria bacterium]
MSKTAVARSQVYGLLTTVFRAEPSETFIRDLRGPRFVGAFSDLGIDLGEEFRTNPEDEIIEELALEFTRLFLGPGRHISAHESIYTEVDGEVGGLWGAKTVQVKKFIETTGLDYESKFTGLPDHISVELEFMRKLAEWEAVKWSDDDSESANYCLTVQKKFIEAHLLKWAPKFCDEVIDKANMPFYRELAKITRDFLEFDYKSINESLSREN